MNAVLLTAEQAAQLLGVGRTTLYGLLRSGALRSVRVGRLRRIPVSAISDFVGQLDDEEAQ